MKREFIVVEDEDEYEEIILSLAALEVRTRCCSRVGVWCGCRLGGIASEQLDAWEQGQQLVSNSTQQCSSSSSSASKAQPPP